jgi:hypothetical protein
MPYAPKVEATGNNNNNNGVCYGSNKLHGA